MTAAEIISYAETSLRTTVESFRNNVTLIVGSRSVQSVSELTGDSVRNTQMKWNPKSRRQLCFLQAMRRNAIRSLETQMDWAECTLEGEIEDNTISHADSETVRAKLRELRDHYVEMCAATEIPGETQ